MKRLRTQYFITIICEPILDMMGLAVRPDRSLPVLSQNSSSPLAVIANTRVVDTVVKNTLTLLFGSQLANNSNNKILFVFMAFGGKVYKIVVFWCLVWSELVSGLL